MVVPVAAHGAAYSAGEKFFCILIKYWKTLEACSSVKCYEHLKNIQFLDAGSDFWAYGLFESVWGAKVSVEVIPKT